MALNRNQYKELFERLLNANLSPEATELLVNWLGNDQSDELSAGLIVEQLSLDTQALDEETQQALERRLQNILENIEEEKPVRRIPFYKKAIWRAAAAVIILVGMGVYFFASNTATDNNQQQLAQVIPTNQITGGQDGAVLTLMDGSTVVLDSLGNGLITTQSGTKVMLKNGQLIYDGDVTGVNVVGYNTMSTPKGRQFQMVLPDGSKVWLNAASSIRYPIVFTGAERLVEITGEAYFEVAHNAAKPFKVKVNEQTEIEVLGTHFNVNSYQNEETINTTLLEGAVRLKSANDKIELRPGQQAKSTNTGNIKVLNSVNTDKVVAWKNGVFDFEDASLQEVMRQLERWYDIEVVYQGNIPKQEFYGKMGKDLSLDVVLSGLEKSNVHFKIEANRKLVVLP